MKAIKETPETILSMYMALRAVEVSLIDDEYYQRFKLLLKTVQDAIKLAEGK